MKIIRVEDKRKGIGLFRRNRGIYDIGELSHVVDKHFTWSSPFQFPTPQEEELDIDKDNKEWYCAFKSEEQFRSIFSNSDAQILISKGFKILELEVTEYQEGDQQILYTKESIKNKVILNNKFK